FVQDIGHAHGAYKPPRDSMSRTLLSLAGFQVIITGRFWVIAEVDELDRPLQRYLGRRRNQRMEVFGHDREVMKQILSHFAVAEKDIDEQVGGGGALE
ncbi:MAG: hypothetical protein WA383_22205, partial [Terriglobales bacterium]